jgi:hypothetical protein
MKNNIAKTNTTNLLSSEEFRTTLQFEADHAIEVRGGHLPYYISEKTRRRLVDPINLLSEDEKQEVIYRIFTSKN